MPNPLCDCDNPHYVMIREQSSEAPPRKWGLCHIAVPKDCEIVQDWIDDLEQTVTGAADDPTLCPCGVADKGEGYDYCPACAAGAQDRIPGQCYDCRRKWNPKWARCIPCNRAYQAKKREARGGFIRRNGGMADVSKRREH